MPHSQVAGAVARYLTVADRMLPGRICGFHVVGSAALGAFRPGRSDIDFVAVTDGDLDARELRRLRLVQLASNVPSAIGALARGQVTLPGTLNGVFVRREDLAKPVTRIRPQASHVGASFSAGKGFDVNPVMWKVLRERGITFRGPAPGELGLDPEPARLRPWNHDNLREYWQPWAMRVLSRRPPPSPPGFKRWTTAWGVLGPPRLHHTIATGEVVSKEAAGEYALDVFPARWHPIVREGLAYWRGEPADPAFSDHDVRRRRTAEFVLEVVADAARL
ncbi:aminoglycoside adenylyltransferase domain-containing protein [Microbispora sp. NPDC049125]|uniref:aminoglycoside adenylyltransferase domain-containing protein n=1 Tax=Microbispora sp. NPDC049125 TaxID=3154929 RepID=UPI0034679FE2